MQFENFKTFVLRKIEKNYGQFYTSYEQYVKDIGNVVIPITYMFELQKAFELQKPSTIETCDCDDCKVKAILESKGKTFRDLIN